MTASVPTTILFSWITTTQASRLNLPSFHFLLSQPFPFPYHFHPCLPILPSSDVMKTCMVYFLLIAYLFYPIPSCSSTPSDSTLQASSAPSQSPSPAHPPVFPESPSPSPSSDARPPVFPPSPSPSSDAHPPVFPESPSPSPSSDALPPVFPPSPSPSSDALPPVYTSPSLLFQRPKFTVPLLPQSHVFLNGITLEHNPILIKMCDKTLNPKLCVSSVTPFLGPKIDPLSVLHSTIQACVNRTKEAIQMATSICDDPTTDTVTAKIMFSCKENYNSVLDDFHDTLDGLAVHDIGRVESVLSAAMTDAGTCDDGFTDFGINKSPVAEIDKMISDMVGLCLDLVRLLPFH